MKKIFLYILMIIGFFILSEFLINVGLNSNYEDIERKDANSEIVVYQADATYVNGRIRGVIKELDKIEGKYLKIQVYSKRDILKGTSYIEINEETENNSQPFELLFKAQDVSYYKIEVVKEKDEQETLETMIKELTKPERMLSTFTKLIIFW